MKMIRQLLLAALFAGAGLHAFAADPIDINQADAAALSGLNGIGQARAEAIIEHRESNGPFRSIEALAEVRGISLNIVDRNRDRITISDDSADED